MTYEDLHAAARRQPFVPFRLILTTGETHDIRHPDLIMVGRRLAVVGLTDNGEDIERTMLIDLPHIVGIELPIGAKSNAS